LSSGWPLPPTVSVGAPGGGIRLPTKGIGETLAPIREAVILDRRRRKKGAIGRITPVTVLYRLFLTRYIAYRVWLTIWVICGLRFQEHRTGRLSIRAMIFMDTIAP
jgi:hypothetical protein